MVESLHCSHLEFDLIPLALKTNNCSVLVAAQIDSDWIEIQFMNFDNT